MSEFEQMKSESVEELYNRYVELSRDIFHLTSELKSMRKIDQPHLIRAKKKERARALGLINQKKAGSNE